MSPGNTRAHSLNDMHSLTIRTRYSEVMALHDWLDECCKGWKYDCPGAAKVRTENEKFLSSYEGNGTRRFDLRIKVRTKKDATLIKLSFKEVSIESPDR